MIRFFLSCWSLIDIIIPNEVTIIERGTFCECTSLTNITIPNPVTSIGPSAFSVCDSLTAIKIPVSVTSIDNYAFNGSRNLTDVYYSGTEEQWNEITIGEYNDELLGATIHFSEPEQPDVSFEDSEDAKVSESDVLVNAGLGTVELLSQAGEGAKILDKDGHELPVDKLPCTGMTLKLSDGTKYIIVVLGDADCDGNLSSSDARLALRASVGLEKYEETSPEFKAANVERGDGLSSADARLILRASVGLEDTKAWLR
ncbi:MAG: leucine-rich repeat protein [Clostridia bacterium]|nr:leucine-rich repeat protein [Clostridia bacterium]